MKLPEPRGPLSDQLVQALQTRCPIGIAGDAADEDDRQLSLWMLYELHYRGFDGVDDGLEWSPDLLSVRQTLEHHFESEVQSLTEDLVSHALGSAEGLVAQLETVVQYEHGPSLASYLHRVADESQYAEFLIQRSLYHLKESDPHAWAVPRLDGRPKVALAELQYDEFGAGVPEHLHSRLFAEALQGAGLDPRYGAYVDRVPADTLAVNNVMSLFGLHRRLRGACMGHLAAFEMTSSLPCRRYLQGAQRLQLDPRVAHYFDEHVEADAVHEQLAARDICAALVDAEPELHVQVLAGAAACVMLDAVAGTAMVQAWQADGSSLRPESRRCVA